MERVNNWPPPHSQKMVEPEFRTKPYFVFLRFEVIGT